MNLCKIPPKKKNKTIIDDEIENDYNSNQQIDIEKIFSNDKVNETKELRKKALELPKQIHHIASNKSSTYTPLFEEIIQKYGLSLDDEWNIVYMHHRGAHPEKYHKKVLRVMKAIFVEADGDIEIFKMKYEKLKRFVSNNPEILMKEYW